VLESSSGRVKSGELCPSGGSIPNLHLLPSISVLCGFKIKSLFYTFYYILLIVFTDNLSRMYSVML